MRPTRALIDLDALRHNYHYIRQQHGGRALAVIKANAYGHGALRCAQALKADADGFAVAFLDEALPLRHAGIKQPILVLEGAFDSHELMQARNLGLSLVVHHEEQLRMLEDAPPGPTIDIWLKMNSGMNRAGFNGDQMRAAWQRLKTCHHVRNITLMSHFARADELDSEATEAQIKAFDEACAGLASPQSLCNSAAALAWPSARRDWARPGIALYGAHPCLPAGTASPLKPVMTLESSVIAIRELSAGAPLGYGARYHCERPARVGLVPVGYADGYPRSAPDGTPVTIDGRKSRLIGRISMDMLTVDLSDLPQASIGSRVELWGAQVPINDVATRAGTIAYELLCNVKRMPFYDSQLRR